MEKSMIEVWLNDRQVGKMTLTDDYLCAFEYTAEWLSNGWSISPFELPLTAGVKIAKRTPFNGGFGVFDDSMPDGWGLLVLDRYLSSQGINIRELSLLEQLCLVGANGRGALTFRPDKSLADTPETINLKLLANEAESILAKETYTGNNLKELVERGGSPGGARPKIFVKDNEGEWLAAKPCL